MLVSATHHHLSPFIGEVSEIILEYVITISKGKLGIHETTEVQSRALYITESY